jgi:hypothetical protein
MNKNIIDMQNQLSKFYNYHKLGDQLSSEVRKKYIDNLPECLNLNGNKNFKLYSIEETLISNGYNRIVIGDYGAFIEFDRNQVILDNIIIPNSQKYRIEDKKYKKNVKYIWLTAKDTSNIKIYQQIKKVSYADYKIGMFYVSPYEIKI